MLINVYLKWLEIRCLDDLYINKPLSNYGWSNPSIYLKTAHGSKDFI